MPWSEVADRARFADSLGFDGVWGFDHFQPMYGEGPGECFEGNTTLAALSGITDGVRLGLLVTGMTYRHPAVFAAEAITIDHASGGRLELSYGAAWFEEEHHAARHPVPRAEGARRRVRGGGADRARPAHHRRLHLRGSVPPVAHATLRPRPVQQPHPPIWIGASGEQRMMPIAARYADVWHCFGGVQELAPKSERLSAMAEASGRDPSEIMRGGVAVTGGRRRRRSPGTSTQWRDAGFGYLVCGWPAGGRATVEEFAQRHLA